MAALAERVRERGVEIELTEDARTLLGNLGYDPTYGARPLKRVIQKRLVDKLALKLLEGEFAPGRPGEGGRGRRRPRLRDGRRGRRARGGRHLAAPMGRRSRKRRRDAGGAGRGGGSDHRLRRWARTARSPCATSSRRARSRKLADLDARPAASAEDRWQRRVEFLFERLVVRWEIAGLPLEGQSELLGRFRLGGADERRAVTRALEEHLRVRHPEVEL